MDKEISKLKLNDYADDDNNPWNKLDDVMVETVLARLPTIDIFHCQLVCKRWKSIIHCSPTFTATSKQLYGRQHPWFILFDSSSRSYSNSLVYDTEFSNWRYVHLRVPTIKTNVITRPVIDSSGGLICFVKLETDYYSFIVNNPLTGVSRSLPNVNTHGKLRGVAMHASKSESQQGLGSSYKIFVVFGDWPHLVMKVFSSSSSENHQEANWKALPASTIWHQSHKKIDWTPIEELVGVTTIGDKGQILVHYLHTSSGRLIGFDTLIGKFFMYGDFVEPNSDWGVCRGSHCVDLVSCGGRVFVVALMDLNQWLCVWKFNYKKANGWGNIGGNGWELIGGLALKQMWRQHIKVGQPIFESDNDTETNVNCSGHDDYIMVSVNSGSLTSTGQFNHVFMYNIKADTWTEAELPPSLNGEDGGGMSFTLPCALEPEFVTKV